MKTQDLYYNDLMQNQKQVNKRFDKTGYGMKGKFFRDDNKPDDYNGIFK